MGAIHPPKQGANFSETEAIARIFEGEEDESENSTSSTDADKMETSCKGKICNDTDNIDHSGDITNVESDS